MTEEEMKAEIEKLTKSVEALEKKNTELLDEKKSEAQKRKDAEAAAAEAAEAKEAAAREAAEKAGDVETLKKQLEAKHAKDMEKLQSEAESYKGQLQKVLIDNGITEALTKSKVAPEFMRGAALQFRDGLEIEMKDGAAFVGDKPLSDAVSEWVQADGAAYIAASGASGSAASGGSQKAAPANGKFSEFKDISGFADLPET